MAIYKGSAKQNLIYDGSKKSKRFVKVQQSFMKTNCQPVKFWQKPQHLAHIL